MTTPPRYAADQLHRYASSLLQKAGMQTELAECVADTLVQGDLLGHDTHGLALLAGYLKELETGSMRAQGAPLVVSDRPAALLWDGQRLPGPWLMKQAMDTLTPRANSACHPWSFAEATTSLALPCICCAHCKTICSWCWPAPMPTRPAWRLMAAPRRCSRPTPWRWAFL